MLKFLLEWLIIVFVFFVFITQIFLPGIRGTKFFPVFSRENELKSRIVELEQSLREKELNDHVKEQETQLNTNGVNN